MKSLLATERPVGYELRGKGRPEAKRRGRFGVCQVGRGRTAGNSAAWLPSSVPAVVKVLRYSTLAVKWLLPSAHCPVLSRTPPSISPPQPSRAPAPCSLPPAAATAVGAYTSLFSQCFKTWPWRRPAHQWLAFQSLSCHSSLQAPWPPRRTGLVPTAAPFRSPGG